jgi:carbamate kinase
MTGIRRSGRRTRHPPRAVVALGGNALLRRGEPLEAQSQARAAQRAAESIARAAPGHQLVITHGNGPQVGLLALMSDAYTATAPYPLDVLDAETEGQIGYVLELELANAMPGQKTVTVLTRIVVNADDPAFSVPSKFIGPVYSESEARALAAERGWSVKPDGPQWRRVVASPQPQWIVQLSAIEDLLDAGFLVVCAGGGGIPVVQDLHGRQHGVEAVIDKDLASALLAGDLGVETLVLATDVDGVFTGYGTPDARQITAATPAGLRTHDFAAGSMGPKVEAVCRFVERTGGRAVIGSANQLDELIAGTAGTQVRPHGPVITYAESQERHDRAA